jgi:zinc protease
VEDRHAAMPALHVNFKVKERRHPDLFALSVVERILGAGETGRLWRRLVKDDSLALSLSVSLDERRGPSLFRVFSLARPGVTLERLEAEILGDLERFATDGPTPREMERARRLLLASAVRATQTTQAIAFLLSEYGLYDGDPGLFRHDVEAVLALDGAAVKDAAARLLVATSRSVVTVVPSETKEAT